jgi:general secretion pathway protein E
MAEEENVEQDDELMPKLNFNFAKRHGVFIDEVSDAGISLAYLKETTPFEAILEVQRCLDRPITLSPIPELEFDTLLARAYDAGAQEAHQAISDIEEDLDLSDLINRMPTTTDLLESEDDAPVIRLLNALMTQAIKQVASDIHFETYEQDLLVRFRVDGVLREVIRPPRMLAPVVVSRLKIMAKLDIAEKRLPQDGRIALRIAGRAIDVRVSTIPTHFGERIVLRILDQKASTLDLRSLGMSDSALIRTRQFIDKPHGIILVTGPTGSGKTTTLYAALTELNNVVRNIMTVEDPIEYYLQGIGQTQVNTKVNMTFAKGLRAILRQDPDVVMVGEIRDVETAEMAVQASLTGHLVLSTLHTNSAIGAITRLRDMGVEPFLLSSTLLGVVAQRLVRLLCQHCKKPHTASVAQLKTMGMALDKAVQIYEPTGCARCNHSGYLGRTGIYELITVDDQLAAMIHDQAQEAKMESYVREASPSIRADGWRRVLLGDTSIDEVLRVSVDK